MRSKGNEEKMARSDMLMVFTYDVSSNKARRRVAKRLEEDATRVQYSVFEGRMSKARADALAQRVAAELGEGDSLRVYAVGANGLERSHIYGDAAPFDNGEGFWVV